MKRYRVELSPEALEQAQALRTWWIENRPAAPDLFVEELGAAIRKLGVDDDSRRVRVHAIWHTSRGQGPT